MAITYVGATSNPLDNATLYDSVERAIDPTGLGAVTGDLIYFCISRKSLGSITLNNTGGQTWTAGTLRQTGSSSSIVYWCRYNGTWSNNPSIVTIANATVVINLFLAVFRPTTGSNTWAIDVAEGWASYSAPVTPYDVTATGRTTIAANTVTIAMFYDRKDTTWVLQTGGWSNTGGAQYRNPDTVNFQSICMSFAHKIQTAAGATGNVVNRQSANPGFPGLWIVDTFKEQSSGVTVSDAGDETYHNGDTGVIVTGTGFGASQGAGFVKISPTNNIADASAVTQSITSWADTSITLSALSLSSFSYFTNLYLFVQANGGSSNSSGFVVQREAWADISATLKNLAGSAQASLSSVIYSVRAASPRGTELFGNTNGTTDGAGLITLPTYVLTSGGTLSPNDDVWVIAGVNGASQALSYATCVKVTPTYS